MSERRDRRDWSERRPAEGVRIIKAEEAQAALEAGEAAGRRPDDELRFGDVPPVPQGPRPAHRFPLPDSVDPASAVPRPPLAVPVHAEDRDRGRRLSPPGRELDPDPGEHAAEELPARQEWDLTDRTTEMSVPPEQPSLPDTDWPTIPAEPPWREGKRQRLGSTEPLRPELGWQSEPASQEPASQGPVGQDPGLGHRSGGAELPHWSDPPTGEVPQILAGGASGPGEDDEDDLEAWRALGTRSTRWRDSSEDWDDVDELADLGEGVEPVGALDQTRSEHSDLYSFDEDFERIESRRTGPIPVASAEEVPNPAEAQVRAPAGRQAQTRPSRAAPRRRPAPTGRSTVSSGPGGEDLSSRVLVGAGLIVLLAICYAIGSKALVVLATVLLIAAAAEGYRMLQRSGFRPATLLGLVATAGICLGAYWKGLEALPLVTVLLFAGSMAWYLMRIVEARPLANVAVTAMIFVWVGLFGSFGSLMLRASHGKGLFLGTVAVSVAADVAAFAVGRWIGSRPMAPNVSPSKTVEGFIGGLVGALIVGAIVGKELTPWGGMKHGLVLGLVVGLLGPGGDLFESMIKRDLGVKDSGTLLGGHGGLLDRFDALLVALPAAYYVASLFSLVR